VEGIEILRFFEKSSRFTLFIITLVKISKHFCEIPPII